MSLDRARGRTLAEAFGRLRPLIIGDLMLDEYLFGDVERISPEAPVPVVRLTREEGRLGGAGNVAANARALGARPHLVGVVGDDPAGTHLKEQLQRLGIATSGLVTAPARPTTRKTRIIAHSQQVVRCDREDLTDIDGALEQQLVDVSLAALPACDVVVVSDYAKGCLTARVLKEVLGAARDHALKVVVDPKLRSFEAYQPATALTPNHHEAAQAAGLLRIEGDDAVERMARALLDRQEAQMMLVTRGEAGMSLVEKEGPATHLKTVAREVYDVTGAGDTVVTAFALALAAGAAPAEAADIANHAAGVVVRKVGTATASPQELLASLP